MKAKILHKSMTSSCHSVAHSGAQYIFFLNGETGFESIHTSTQMKDKNVLIT